MISRPHEWIPFEKGSTVMKQLIARSLSTIVVAVSLLMVVPADAFAQLDTQRGLRPVMRRPIPAAALRGSVDFLRTELFFGTAKPTASSLTKSSSRSLMPSSRRDSPMA